MALAKLYFDVPSELVELVGEVLIGLGAGAVEEQEGKSGARLVVYGEQEAELAGIAERAHAVITDIGIDTKAANIEWHVEVDTHSDWETAWTRYLVQQPLTPRWVIQPEWDSTPAPPGMGKLLIRPVLAFGDGAHVTTRLAAEAVERSCIVHPGSNVLDIGTGTGVLALIAALSAAKSVVGTDIDAVALNAAWVNAKLNGLETCVVFQTSSEPLPAGFDLVVANLEPRALLQAKTEIANHARKARELVLTGFLSEQAAEVGTAFCTLGFTELTRAIRDGWCLLVLAPVL